MLTLSAPFFILAVLLIVADAAGLIDLSTRPLPRVMKWICAATIALLLPGLAQKLFHLQIDEKHLILWRLFVFGVLLTGIASALFKWIWRHYGPAPQGHRRCPHCHTPILKVMLECPACRKSLPG